VLDHLLDPPLVDAQLKRDFLLGHLSRLVEFDDPPRQLGRHLLTGDAPRGGSFAWHDPAP
jgi:hypothetical protein